MVTKMMVVLVNGYYSINDVSIDIKLYRVHLKNFAHDSYFVIIPNWKFCLWLSERSSATQGRLGSIQEIIYTKT